jgi:Sulfatase
MNLLKRIPFFLFLLPVFFCLHGWLQDFEVLTASELLLLVLYISIALALLFLAVWLVTKNKANAALITFYTGLLYIFFGALQDWLQGNFLSFLNRYIILLPLMLISIFVLAWFLKQKPAFQKKLFLYLNILLIIYCLLDAGLLVNKSLNIQKDTALQVPFDHKKVKAKPDVYYLLFDEYPGYKSLEAAFGFKNDSLYSFLQGNGFTILPAVSNYNFTVFSMASIFNMRYIDNDYNHEHGLTDQRDFRNRSNEIKNGAVFSIYKSMGYRLENYSIFDVGNQHCINPDKSFLPVHIRVLTNKMLHNRMRKHIGWWFRGTILQDFFIKKEAIYENDATNNDIIALLNKSVLAKNDKPTFYYAHLAMPHAPYFRDSTGALIENKALQEGYYLSDNRYFLPYLKYTNTVIRSLVNKIVQQNPGALIVVMSDHGFRDYNNHKEFYLPAFDNICAVRFPAKNIPPYKDSLSGVNFFRYVFNSQYGQQIPYLKDSTIWINY